MGLATYEVEGDICELVTMNAFVAGAGAPLLAAVADAARAAGCSRLRVMTTNGKDGVPIRDEIDLELDLR